MIIEKGRRVKFITKMIVFKNKSNNKILPSTFYHVQHESLK